MLIFFKFCIILTGDQSQEAVDTGLTLKCDLHECLLDPFHLPYQSYFVSKFQSLTLDMNWHWELLPKINPSVWICMLAAKFPVGWSSSIVPGYAVLMSSSLV